MSNLTILKTSIRTYSNLYSLNDLHVASGNNPKHRPNQFIRLDTTQDLVNEIRSEDPDAQICASLRTGINKGTWACEELSLVYATWISPKFHLVVLRAFIAMHKGEAKPQQIALPEQEKKFTFELIEYELQQLGWDWFALSKCIEFIEQLRKPLELLGSAYSAKANGIVAEYGSMLKRHHPLIDKLTAQFSVDGWGDENWNRILPTIRRCRPQPKNYALPRR